MNNCGYFNNKVFIFNGFFSSIIVYNKALVNSWLGNCDSYKECTVSFSCSLTLRALLLPPQMKSKEVMFSPLCVFVCLSTIKITFF